MSKRRGPPSRISQKRMKKLREAYAKYTDPKINPEERPTQLQLAEEYGEPQSTISYWFTRFKEEDEGYTNQTTPEITPEQVLEESEQPSERKGHKGPMDRTALRKTAGAAMSHISDRATKAAEQAIIIGDIIMSQYGDLVKIAFAKGLPVEELIKDVFNFYEQKTQLTRYTEELEKQLAALMELTEPNWRYKHKTSLLYRFARDVLLAKQYGVKVNPKKAVRALQIELEKIDQQEVMVIES